MQTETEVRPPSINSAPVGSGGVTVEQTIASGQLPRRVGDYLAAAALARTAHDWTKTVIVREGFPKVGPKAERDPKAPKGPTFMPAIAGRVLDSARQDIDRTPAERQRLRRRRYRHMPPVVLGWAMLADEVAPQILERLAPPPGCGAEVVQEAPLFADGEAQRSAGILQATLVYEQEHGDGSPGPFERALRLSPTFNLGGRRKVGFKKALGELPDDFPLTKKEVEGHIRNARSYHFAEDGNLIVCPTVKPDVVSLLYKEDDPEARYAATALAEVLRAGIGFDAESLHQKTFRFRQPAPNVEDSVDGLAAIHWALRLVGEGRVILQVADVKAQTHAGKIWEALEWYWEEYGGDLERIFSDENLSSTNAKFGDLQVHFGKYVRDLARTVYALASWLEFGEREFYALNQAGGEPMIPWDGIVAFTRALGVFVDFNIMKSRAEILKAKAAAQRPSRYKTVPREEELAVPKQVGIVVKEVPYRLLRGCVRKRSAEMRTQLCRRHEHELGRLAVGLARANINPAELDAMINA